MNLAPIKNGEDARGNILIDADYIQSDMDSLRMLIGSIGMVAEDDNEDFKDVYSEIYTEDSNETMVVFNENDN